MKEREITRAGSFAIVALVYALAIVAGIACVLVCSYLTQTPVLQGFRWKLLVADVLATVVTFAFSVAFKNASVYDPYWSVQPIVILLAVIPLANASLLGVLAVAVVCLWGVRLTANWAYTFHGLSHQDWRYTKLHDQTGKWYPFVNFFGIHLVPTLVVYACTLPAVAVLLYAPEFSVFSAVCLAVSVCAVLLQGTADVQMHKFRKGGRGGFIRTGLWKHSRHPNYLGEILMWWGIGGCAVFAISSAWYLLGGAVLNTLLFLCISIPLADGRQSRKEGFSEYKAQTRMLLPIPKRQKKQEVLN